MKPSASVCPATVQPGGLDQKIRFTPDQVLDVRFHGCRSAAGTAPLVLHFHGGSFTGGSLDTGAGVAGLLADAGAVVMALDYPLAPAHPFPQAVEAGYAALVWAFKARGRLAGHGASVYLAGEEAGANIAAAVALMARDRQGPALSGQILLSPMLDPCLATASLRQAHAGPVGCIWADGWHQYLGRMENAAHPYAAPGTALRLAGLPATLLVTAQDDPLRDEAVAYAARLCAAGLPVQQAVLAELTGWPCSYFKPGVASAAWASALRQQFSDFFSRTDSSNSQFRPFLPFLNARHKTNS